MKNKINTSRILLAASIIGIVLLSGCVGNNNTKTTPVPTETPVITQPTPSTTPVTVITYNASDNVSKNSGYSNKSTKSTNTTNSTNSTSLTATGSDWCTPGNTKKVAGTVFTITGLITDNKGITLCNAEAVIPNGKAVHQFSKDGSVSKTNSSASNGNASASANSSSSVNTSK